VIELHPSLICLAPIRNESWILERYLQCASTWADHIIIGDQRSDDGSREIANRFPKATLVDNSSSTYDEGARQRLLIDTARRIVPERKRILIALDADEMLTANFRETPEWQALLAAAPGTVVRFDWVNVLPGFETCWIPAEPLPLGFVDDGSPHGGEAIHSARIPVRPGAPSLVLHDIKVLHYQYTNWQRMESKQRWYQCWEHLKYPKKRAIAIFRQYRGMYARPPEQIHPFRSHWIDAYEQAGIEMKDVRGEAITWWDQEIVGMLRKHGAAFFRKQDIWGVDWIALARQLGGAERGVEFADPRSPFEKKVHQWLLRTQPRAFEPKVRWIQRSLRLFGW
jgi:hypothetical protein